MYGGTLLAIVWSSASVSGSFRNAHPSRGGRFVPAAASDPYARLVATVWELLGYRRPQMHDDRHAVLVGGAKHPPELLDVLRIVGVDDGVAECSLRP